MALIANSCLVTKKFPVRTGETMTYYLIFMQDGVPIDVSSYTSEEECEEDYKHYSSRLKTFGVIYDAIYKVVTF